MIEEIIAELTTELTIADPHLFNAELLKLKVDGAYRKIRAAKKYPSFWSEAVIEADMQKEYVMVLEQARTDYNKIGAEGQKSYHEDGVTIHYSELEPVDRIIPIAQIAQKA
jgi:hypothetical protein